MKETEDDSKKWKDIPRTWIRRINIVKKQSNLQVQCNTYQKTHNIFHRTRTNNPEIYMEP